MEHWRLAGLLAPIISMLAPQREPPTDEQDIVPNLKPHLEDDGPQSHPREDPSWVLPHRGSRFPG